MHLLDTNVVSELRRKDRCDENVREWHNGVSGEDLFISVLTLGEIRKGVAQKRGNDPTQAAVFENWLRDVVRQYEGRTLPVDGRIADVWGEMYAIRNVAAIDGLLAATAKIHGMTLVTRNVPNVEGLGVDIINPFLG